MRKLATAALGAVVLCAVAAPSAPAAAPGKASAKRTYVVLYKQGVSHAKARKAIRRAGGRIVSENRAVGLATVIARARRFAARARLQRALAGTAANRSIGRARERLNQRRAVERGKDAGGLRARTVAEEPVEGDPLSSLQWDMQMINATATGSYAVQRGSHDVLVGDIDTGIDGSHPDLAANFDATLSRNFTVDDPTIDGPCAEDPDGSCLDPPDVDEGGHGTHTAGTIGAALNGLGVAGVAPDVGLVNLRAGQDSGFFFLQPTVDAITYAADVGVDVVNMSFFIDPWLYNCRANAADSPAEQQQQATVIDATQRAVDYARARGVTLVAALGNEHTDLGNPTVDETSPDFPPGSERTRTVNNSCLDMPTEAEGVIAVSSVGRSGRKAYYSNWGTEQTDVAAPGGDIRDFFGNPDLYRKPGNIVLSTAPQGVLAEEGLIDENGEPTSASVVKDCQGDVCGYYQYLQGTSMAAPHAAGVAALIVAEYGRPDRRHGGVRLNPNRVQRILERTAVQHQCPTQNPFTYPDPDLVPSPEAYTARCEGGEEFNGFYGHGIVDALGAVGGRQ